MRSQSSSILIVSLLFAMTATSQFSIHAQSRKTTLSKESAVQTPQANTIELDTPKIETAGGGPKKETKATRPKDLPLSLNAEANPGLELSLATGSNPTSPGVITGTKNTGPSSAKTTITYDVGIIPGANGCPAGSELITLYLDDEDNHNANSSSGWVGATVQDLNTAFKFCRVDGSQFPVISGHTYAVLQLGTQCPNGSMVFARKFDNENHKNNNSSSGSISPSYVNKTQSNAQLVFCAFTDKFGLNANSQFPNLGVEYGVFAPSDFPGAVDTGSFHIDDEDDDNTNSYAGQYAFLLGEADRIVSGSYNTDINVVKIKSGPVYGNLNSVSLNVSSIVGDGDCDDIVITVNLDGPAKPGGQKVEMSSSDQTNAGIFDPKYFMIPEGKWSESASCFMGTKKKNKDVTITVWVNGQPGYVNLSITRK